MKIIIDCKVCKKQRTIKIKYPGEFIDATFGDNWNLLPKGWTLCFKNNKYLSCQKCFDKSVKEFHKERILKEGPDGVIIVPGIGGRG